MLITELSRSGKFEVLESTALADLREEIGLGEQGWVKFDEKVQRGEWDAADYMLRATITRFGARTKKWGGFGGLIRIDNMPGGFETRSQEAEVQIEWRIVDVENRRVRKTGRATGKHKGSSWSFGWITGGGGFSETEFLDSTLGKATMLALQTIAVDLDKLDLPPGRRTQRIAATRESESQTAIEDVNALRATPGQVVGLGQDGSVVINLGAMHHLKPGDILTLFQPVETLNAEGKVIFTQQREVTTLTLSVVQDEFSKATLDHPASPREGWKVRWFATADSRIAAHR
jgi:curli biogenesis system outer membrane secretion channel CsgG